MVTREEIAVAVQMHRDSVKALVDIYLEFALDGQIGKGVDIEEVIQSLRTHNLCTLKTEVGWATVLLIRNHIEFTRQAFTLRMNGIAHSGNWLRIPVECYRAVYSVAVILPIYLRRCCCPWSGPLVTPTELDRLHTLRWST